jgi:hypothetical protein
LLLKKYFCKKNNATLMKKILGIGNALVDVLVEVKDEVLLQKFGLKKGGMEMISADIKNNIHREIQGLKKTVDAASSTPNTNDELSQV